MQVLPIDPLLPEIVASLRRAPNLVVEAPPGAGKTTRVPVALLEAGLADDAEIWVLEPRRLATRMAARYVAGERGEQLGETVGYQVRFEEVASARTRLRFLTEGVLTRKLLSDPQLSKVKIVVLDEFHERHLQADLCLALLRRLQLSARQDLRIIVMSATLDAGPIASFLGECPSLRSEGRRFDVQIEHLLRPDDRPLAIQVASAVRRLVDEGLDGDVLVFLPGAAEIRRAQEACAELAARAGLVVVPLHGELSPAEQDRAVRPATQRKIILSTNVAETSVTIEGVVAVIDSGLARVAGHTPWSGLPTLNVARISQASATQRAGRAGRVRPGRCLRLYTAQDLAARPARETPEVRRLDMAEPVLELHAAGVNDPRAFAWFEPPPAAALEAAEALLRRLGALDARGAVTELGQRMLRLPLHPRLARVVVEAEARGAAREGCLIAALISERDIRAGRVTFDGRERERTPAGPSGPSDLLDLLDLFRRAEQAGFAPDSLHALGLEPGAVRAVERARRQLERVCQLHGTEAVRDRGAPAGDQEKELLISILAGYPDRVARRRVTSGGADEKSAELALANGSAALLAPESVVRRAEFLVAVDAEQRRLTGGSRSAGRSEATVVRLASAIEPEWLLDLFAEAIRETTKTLWNAQAERVEVVERLMYDQIAIAESRAARASGPEVSALLAEAALAAGPQAFVAREVIDQFLARVSFVAQTLPHTGIRVLNEDDVRASLARLCEGRRSFAELRAAAGAGALLEELRRRLSPEEARLLAELAPERVRLPSGRQARVNYEEGKPPWVASRLQDFFGAREGPRIAAGRVPLVLRLLAPNQRPVQVTADLAGFWARVYPQVRRELSRRYPRHAWPEDPLAAAPPER
jgi:ATP-dependent helicase HrpB